MKFTIKQLITIILVIGGFMSPVTASAQALPSKKKQTIKTVQNQSQKNRQRQEAAAKRRLEEEARQQREAEARQQEERERQQREAEATRQPSGYINGHEWINLGLPSGTKWATCNVGASSPTDYGSYFAWGETSLESDYFISDSKTFKKNIADISGNPDYDAARANWGGTWRMPTKAESQELVDKCSWTWTTQGGKKGYKVTGPNGNSIFLPAAGYRHGTSLGSAGEGGSCWCSTPDESDTGRAYYLWFNESRHRVYWNGRYYGQSVRPVTE